MAENNEQSASKRRGPGRPFKPGQTGNPGGRPKGLAAMVREVVGEDGQQLVKAMAVIAVGTAAQVRTFFGEHVKRTARDRMQAVEFLADRGFGKAPQEVSVTGADGGAVRVVFGGRYKPEHE